MQRIMVLVLLCLFGGYDDTKLQSSASECCSSISALSHHSCCSALRDYVCVQKGHVHDLKGTHPGLFLFVPENLMV